MSDDVLSRLFTSESGDLLNQALTKIRHCLKQLSSEQIWWRPHPSGNSIGNLILHICGNLRQWSVVGIEGLPDDRQRSREFSSRETVPGDELLELAARTIESSQAIFARLNPEQLAETRTIQGFDVSVVQAIMHTTTHFVGHTHQIIYITRMILGERYEFQWTPDGDRRQLPI